MALTTTDIKRVLAYSTISQLGYMFMALGLGAYTAAVFHLFTHAFFKAGLFLSAGSVHHAAGTFNMKYMGGLKSKMKYTYYSMTICALSLSGLFPLSGFWSKDEIVLSGYLHGGYIGYICMIIGLLVAFLTSFYMFRAISLTFMRELRGGGDKESEDIKTKNLPVPETVVCQIPSPPANIEMPLFLTIPTSIPSSEQTYAPESRTIELPFNSRI